jgi:hypothetical protein
MEAVVAGCIIGTVTAVEPHPHPDGGHLNVVRTDGGQFVCMKLDGGVPRYAVGDLVVHLPDGAVLPTALLRRLGVWDDDAGRGTMKGSIGNRVKASRFKGVLSDGMLFPVGEVPGGPHAVGDDLAAVLGVTVVVG